MQEKRQYKFRTVVCEVSSVVGNPVGYATMWYLSAVVLEKVETAQVFASKYKLKQPDCMARSLLMSGGRGRKGRKGEGMEGEEKEWGGRRKIGGGGVERFFSMQTF